MARSKIIYFIRHGESELNARGIRQGADGKLTEKGRDQVRRAADILFAEPIKIKKIIASPFERTQETAAILAERLGCRVEYSHLLVERKNPTEIVGHSGEEKPVQSIVDRIDKGYHDDWLRYSDEENFIDLKIRAKKLLRMLARRRERVLLCVTHGIFLRLVASYVQIGETLSANDYIKISAMEKIENAGIVACSYTHHWFKKDEWKLLAWNGKPIE